MKNGLEEKDFGSKEICRKADAKVQEEGQPRPAEGSQKWARHDGREILTDKLYGCGDAEKRCSQTIPRFPARLTGKLMLPATQIGKTCKQEKICLWGKILRIVCLSWRNHSGDHIYLCTLKIVHVIFYSFQNLQLFITDIFKIMHLTGLSFIFWSRKNLNSINNLWKKRKYLRGAFKNHLWIKKKQFVKMFFTTTTPWFTLPSAEMFRSSQAFRLLGNFSHNILSQNSLSWISKNKHDLGWTGPLGMKLLSPRLTMSLEILPIPLISQWEGKTKLRAEGRSLGGGRIQLDVISSTQNAPQWNGLLLPGATVCLHP